MCKSVEEYAARKATEAAEEAKETTWQTAIKTSIEAWQDVDIEKEQMISKLMKKYQLDEETALSYYEKYSLQTV